MSVFATTAETRERHPDARLQTPYFKANYKTVKEAVKQMAKTLNYEITSENDHHGELFLKGRRAHLIASIIQVMPTETAVDLKMETYRLFGFGKPKKNIVLAIDTLKRTLQYKGSGLHP